MKSDRSKSFDLYYPEVGFSFKFIEPGTELKTISVTNSNIFKPYSKSKFRFARNDLVSMNINQDALAYFNNQIIIDVVLDFKALNY